MRPALGAGSHRRKIRIGGQFSDVSVSAALHASEKAFDTSQRPVFSSFHALLAPDSSAPSRSSNSVRLPQIPKARTGRIPRRIGHLRPFLAQDLLAPLGSGVNTVESITRLLTFSLGIGRDCVYRWRDFRAHFFGRRLPAGIL